LEENGLVLKYIGKKHTEGNYHPLTQLDRSGENRSACWLHPCKLSHTTTVWPVLLWSGNPFKRWRWIHRDRLLCKG
jgi:hypothetical protein